MLNKKKISKFFLHSLFGLLFLANVYFAYRSKTLFLASPVVSLGLYGFTLFGILTVLLMTRKFWIQVPIFIFIASVFFLLWYLPALGADSAFETLNATAKESFSENLAFIESIIPYYQLKLHRHWKFVLILTLFFGMLSCLIRGNTSQIKHRKLTLISGVGMVLCLAMSLQGYAMLYQKVLNYPSELQLNFSCSPSTLPLDVQKKPRDIQVFMFVGESTSRFDSGLYGYIRDTNPLLTQRTKNSGFIVFDHVLSTHTQTSPSLLEALTFPQENSLEVVPIFERKRIGLIKTLSQLKIPTQVWSNQGSSGSFNLVSPLIFNDADEVVYSVNGVLLGNDDGILGKPYDSDFLDKFLKEGKIHNEIGLKVFHSYAGHAPYLGPVPTKYQSGFDDSLTKIAPESILGANVEPKIINEVNKYDVTQKYVDRNIDTAMQYVDGESLPAVVFYFSDHGESAYTEAKHDSSRYNVDMITPSVLMYFNQAAQKKYPELVEKYRKISTEKNISTLANIPNTVLDLFGLALPNEDFPLIGQRPKYKTIVVRDSLVGMTSQTLDVKNIKDREKNDKDLDFYIESRHVSNSPMLCYQGANTLGRVLRASLISECIQVDINTHQKQLVLSSKNNDEIALPLNEVVKVPRLQDKTVLLTIHQFKEKESLLTLKELIKKNPKIQFILEFKNYQKFELLELNEILKLLSTRDNVKAISYAMPSTIVEACLKEDSNKDCQKFLSEVTSLSEVTDISAPKEVIETIGKQLPDRIRLNVNNVEHAWERNQFSDQCRTVTVTGGALNRL